MCDFRDWLRENAADRERYESTKCELATKELKCVQNGYGCGADMLDLESALAERGANPLVLAHEKARPRRVVCVEDDRAREGTELTDSGCSHLLLGQRDASRDTDFELSGSRAVEPNA